ncbi:hypothetical protein C8J98_10584 [Luteibacter sp. OK325]|nr:hypothetical protein [Luteibacter sp. OK325]PTR32531.1 hypothetical protein C8J98_10584 [Luteibacter sp. OK325]
MSKLGNQQDRDEPDDPLDEETENSREREADEERGGGPSRVTTNPGIKNT